MFSFLIILMLLAFSSFKLYTLIYRINPNISEQSFWQNLNTAGTFQPQTQGNDDNAFTFAFGLGVPLDPSIGYYSVNQVSYFYPANLTVTSVNASNLNMRTKVRTPL